MLAGIFHSGSGLGDQLFRYVTVRTLAEKKGLEWMMTQSNNFKGYEFFHDFEISSGPSFNVPQTWSTWNEKDVRDAYGNDIRSYDPEINFIEDNTIIDGSFEDDKYWRHNLDNISKWLAVEPLEVDESVCVIGFRGGEYYSEPKLGLPQQYFSDAMQIIFDCMESIPTYQGTEFQIHTDDPDRAREFFPKQFQVIENEQISHSKHTNMALNWRSARYAKYAIIPNSAFFILPRILKHHEDPTAVTIAPRGWARRNLSKGNKAGDFLWARPSCYYPEFIYV